MSEASSELNGIELSPTVRWIDTLRVSRPELRSLVKAMHDGMTAWATGSDPFPSFRDPILLFRGFRFCGIFEEKTSV
jgi:hypothetical protein